MVMNSTYLERSSEYSIRFRVPASATQHSSIDPPPSATSAKGTKTSDLVQIQANHALHQSPITSEKGMEVRDLVPLKRDDLVVIRGALITSIALMTLFLGMEKIGNNRTVGVELNPPVGVESKSFVSAEDVFLAFYSFI